MERLEVFSQSILQVMQDEFPDVVGPFRYPMKAKVLAVKNGKADLQLLDDKGLVLDECPALPGVTVPNRLGGLIPGMLVRVGFYYHDPAQAFIEDLV
ncbi:hypothetical protein JCM15765_02690 [Paradesulfitobacterium aromaticivorans]